KDGATYTSINGSNSFAYGINDAGQIVGEENGQGFLTDIKGTSITSFACNFSNETIPTGINSKGQIVGWLNDTNTNSTRAFVTNVNALASCSPFDFPGSTATQAWGINGKGETVGVFWDANGEHGFFINAAGQHFKIDIPGSTQTQAFGVNDSGQIVGTYTDAATFSSYGFLLANVTALTSFTKIDMPNSGGSTNVNGINNTGQIVGSFQDLTTPITTFHAFVGKTPPVL